MKVLVIHNILWAHYKSVLFQEIQNQLPSDIQFHVLQIAKNELARKNMETESISYDYDYTLLFDDYAENIPKWKEIVKVIQFVLKYKPDVINVTGYAANISTIPVILLAKVLGKKIILSNESTTSDASVKGLKGWLKKTIFRLSDGFIVFGKSSESYLLNLGAKPNGFWVKNAAIVDNKHIREIYQNNKNKVLFERIKTQHNFIFVGRISEEKNILMLVKAFQNLKNKRDWGLIIVGQGAQENEVSDKISEQPQSIYKFDAVGWKEIPLFFTQSDCLVLPSKSEPWGLVVNEAMICEQAIIASEAVGCAEDLVKNENGIIVKTNSQKSLENGMQQIIDSTDLEAMKNASVEIIKDFSVDNVAREFISQLTRHFKN